MPTEMLPDWVAMYVRAPLTVCASDTENSIRNAKLAAVIAAVWVNPRGSNGPTKMSGSLRALDTKCSVL